MRTGNVRQEVYFVAMAPAQITRRDSEAMIDEPDGMELDVTGQVIYWRGPAPTISSPSPTTRVPPSTSWPRHLPTAGA